MYIRRLGLWIFIKFSWLSGPVEILKQRKEVHAWLKEQM